MWVDLSNHNGPLTDAMCDDMLATGVVGIVSQCITGLDGRTYTSQQLLKAQLRGLRIAGYAWAWGSPSVASRLRMFDGYRLEWLALDVEDNTVTLGSVDRDFALCDGYLGRPTELYTGRWFFQGKGWLNTTRWSKRWLWDAIYDLNPDPQYDFLPFSGWTRCRTKQYWDKQVYGNNVCDVNFRLTTSGLAA